MTATRVPMSDSEKVRNQRRKDGKFTVRARKARARMTADLDCYEAWTGTRPTKRQHPNLWRYVNHKAGWTANSAPPWEHRTHSVALSKLFDETEQAIRKVYYRASWGATLDAVYEAAERGLI